MESLTTKKDRILVPAIAAVSLMFGLFLFQDLTRSQLRDYNFYLSEAALFNCFWLLFLPGIIFSRWWLGGIRSENNYRHLRIFLIITVAATLHLALFVCWVHGASWLFLDHVYALRWTFRYTLGEHLSQALIGYTLIVMALAIRKKRLPAGRAISPGASTDVVNRIAVKTNLQTIYLDVGQITCLRAESPYVAIHTRERKYLEDITLKALTEKLPPDLFVRIHRSCIVNLACVSSSTSRGNGDYDVLLKDGSTHRLSRNYAADYKCRIRAHQLTR